MLRILSGSGLTTKTSLAQANTGYKWRIINAQISVITGSVAGTRVGWIYVSRKSGLFPYPTLAYVSNSDTDATISGSGGVGGANSSVTNTEWQTYPEASNQDLVYIDMTIEDGDTVSYYLLVDEVLDE